MTGQLPAADRSLPDPAQGVGLALLDTSARLMFASDGFVAMNKHSMQEQLGRTVADLWPQVWPLVAERFAEVLAGEASDFDMSLPDPEDGGRLRGFHVYWFPVRVQDTVIGVSATVIDVKALRASETRAQELAERQQALRRIANRALTDSPIDELFEEALAALERLLDVPLTRSMRIEVGSSYLGQVTGRGWDEEFLALWKIGPRTGSFADLAIASNHPIQFEDLRQAQPFRKSELFAYHGVLSGIGQAVRVGGGLRVAHGDGDLPAEHHRCRDAGRLDELAARWREDGCVLPDAGRDRRRRPVQLVDLFRRTAAGPLAEHLDGPHRRHTERDRYVQFRGAAV